MNIDLVASLPHYREHLDPIFDALGRPGVVTTPMRARGLSLVAGWQDAEKMARAPKIYVEHGAGQTYFDAPPSASNAYSGGSGLSLVRGFICPGPAVLARRQAAYPGVPAIAVGCPKLDQFVGVRPEERTVAITFHWPAKVSVESGSALGSFLPYLAEAVEAWRDAGWTVIGHAHPRWVEQMAKVWQRREVEFVEDEADVFRRATMLVADNTSLLPEFMALGRPVVFLSDPSWRRQIHHGGRFWEWIDGQVHVTEPADLIFTNLDDAFEPARLERAGEIADSIYSYRDGSSAQRAADFITEICGG